MLHAASLTVPREGKPPIVGQRADARRFRRAGFRTRPDGPWPTMPDDAVARALALISESFIAATGPGGQNVNKVATAVQLRRQRLCLGWRPKSSRG